MNKGPLRASEEEKFQIKNVWKCPKLYLIVNQKSDTNVTTKN